MNFQQVKFVQPNLAVADGHIRLVTDDDSNDAAADDAAADAAADDDDEKLLVNSSRISNGTIKFAPSEGLFVHQEPCSIFFRNRQDVQRLQDFIGSSTTREEEQCSKSTDHDTKKGPTRNEPTSSSKTVGNSIFLTGRWHSLKNLHKSKNHRDYQVMRFHTVLTTATERNRKGTRLIECHCILELGGITLATTVPPTPTMTTTNAAVAPDSETITTTHNNNVSGGEFQMFDKSHRQDLFADWLVQTYGQDFLARGSGVLDVAGGKGDLSRALQKRGIPSVVLDPNPRLGPDAVGIPVIGLALMGDGSYLFRERQDGLHHVEKEHDGTTAKIAIPTSRTATLHEQQFIRTCSMIVGMHPDEATEPIVRLVQWLAMQTPNTAPKPMAILPCCVMPSLFPHRVYQGQPVRSYKIFCEYLQSLYNNNGNDDLSAAVPTNESLRMKVDFLPFMGRNMILYTTPPAGLSTAQKDTEC